MKSLPIIIYIYLIKTYFFRFLNSIKVIIFHFSFQRAKEGLGDRVVPIDSILILFELDNLESNTILGEF